MIYIRIVVQRQAPLIALLQIESIELDSIRERRNKQAPTGSRMQE
jgi:hypothetical protein